MGERERERKGEGERERERGRGRGRKRERSGHMTVAYSTCCGLQFSAIMIIGIFLM